MQHTIRFTSEGGESCSSLNLGWPTLHCVVNTLLQIPDMFLIVSFTHLFCFRAVKVPTTDLIIASKHVHGHHAYGERDCADNHLPLVRGHQEAVHSEQMGQHAATDLPKKTNV